VVIPNFTLLENEDGSVTLTGEGTANVFDRKTGFDFVVDRKRGTYSTKKIDPAKMEERSVELFQSGESTAGDVAPPGDGAIVPLVSPGHYYGRVRVVTRDPAFITLTETSTSLTWYVYSSGSVAWTNYSDGCWAANPSALGTHWYTSYCGYGSPWYASAYYACNANSGRYYNWDFGSNTQITEVAQTAKICGRNDAYYDYWWSHNDAGEASYLIFGSVFLG
jgi:hypothetical protein